MEIFSKLKKLLFTIEYWISRHFLLSIGSIIAIYMLVGVPQVKNILLYAPRPAVDRIIYIILIVFFLWINITTIIIFIRPKGPTAEQIKSKRLRSFFSLLCTPARWMIRLLIRAIQHTNFFQSASARYLISIILTCIGMLGTYYIPFNLNTPYLLFGGFLKMSAIWFMFVGIWLFFGAYFEINASSNTNTELTNSICLDEVKQIHLNVWTKCGEVLSWLFVTHLIVETMWVSPNLKWFINSFQLYSVLAIIQVAFTIVVVAGLVDYLQFPDGKHRSKLPTRLIVIVLAFICLWTQSGDTIDDPVIPNLAITNTSEDSKSPSNKTWIDALERRLDSIPEGPIIIVAASGGGSRAALFTSLVLEMLNQQEMQIPQMNSTIKKKNANSHNQSSQKLISKWSDHILLISSVSGGSLATARFLDNGGRDPMARISDKERCTSQYDLFSRTREKLKEWACHHATDELNEDHTISENRKTFTQIKEIERYQSLFRILSRLESQLSNPNSKNESSSTQKRALVKQTNPTDREELLFKIADQSFHSRYVDEMNINFMAPILRGFLTPFISRGQGLYFYWDNKFNWNKHRQFTPFHESKPLALINTTDLDAGRRVIIGFPPLPQGFLTNSPTKGISKYWRDKEVTINSHPEQEDKIINLLENTPLCLADYAGDQETDLTLSRAVRLSANFPWGFDVPVISAYSSPQLKMHKHAPSVRGIKNRERLRLLDGGVVDNTGVDSIYAVFSSLRAAAQADPLGKEIQILKKLRERGIVLLEIDSGATPSAHDKNFNPFGQLTLPLTGLNNASYTNALQKRDDLIIKIQEILSETRYSKILSKIKKDPEEETFIDVKVGVSKEGLIQAVSAMLPLPDATENILENDLITVVHHRFKCNRINDTAADVMTAFALGPEDKATVFALFLTEAVIWNETRDEFRKQFDEYKKINNDNSVSYEYVAELVRLLIDSSKVTIATTQENFTDLRLKWRHRPQTDEEKKIVASRLLRPYLLLKAVQGLAQAELTTENTSHDLWKELENVVTKLFGKDDESIAGISQKNWDIDQRGVIIDDGRTKNATLKMFNELDHAKNLTYRLSSLKPLQPSDKQKQESRKKTNEAMNQLLESKRRVKEINKSRGRMYKSFTQP